MKERERKSNVDSPVICLTLPVPGSLGIDVSYGNRSRSAKIVYFEIVKDQVNKEMVYRAILHDVVHVYAIPMMDKLFLRSTKELEESDGFDMYTELVVTSICNYFFPGKNLNLMIDSPNSFVRTFAIYATIGSYLDSNTDIRERLVNSGSLSEEKLNSFYKSRQMDGNVERSYVTRGVSFNPGPQGLFQGVVQDIDERAIKFLYDKLSKKSEYWSSKKALQVIKNPEIIKTILSNVSLDFIKDFIFSEEKGLDGPNILPKLFQDSN